jgi:hypothetical protein
MGCYTFARTEDMFEFFGMSDSDFNKSNIINPEYWEEKIQSNSVFKDTKEFDFKRKIAQAKEKLAEIAADYKEQFLEELKK